MQTGARIAAAIEVLEDVLNRHQPIALALAAWGKAHRFAGSGDRNAIGGLVYDALRRRASISWAFESDGARALALGAASSALGIMPEAVIAACDGSGHAPAALSDIEQRGLTRSLDDAPEHAQADIPEWLWPRFVEVYGGNAVAEGQAMSRRAPADLRVNTLKSTRDIVLKELTEFGAETCALSPIGLRVAPPTGAGRTPNLQAEAAFQEGWFEIQDEGSQLAALMVGAGPGMNVIDLCAGAGGKTLAIAAAMQNKGQIYAYDEDRLRLKPIFDRVHRSGLRNIQILRGGDKQALGALGAKFDRVLVDAPCTGSGTWRRRPDAKWKLKPEAVLNRIKEQREVLKDAARLVKPGGRLIYVTCSILPEENGGQVAAFLRDNGAFSLLPYADVWREVLPGEPPLSADGGTGGLMLTPGKHGTDGFFISVLARAA